jgi:hypothetical protein
MESKYEMNRAEANYFVDVRSEKIVKEQGSIEKAIKFLQDELNSYEYLWGEFAYDCLGHAITCNRLMIGYLIRKEATSE